MFSEVAEFPGPSPEHRITKHRITTPSIKFSDSSLPEDKKMALALAEGKPYLHPEFGMVRTAMPFSFDGNPDHQLFLYQPLTGDVIFREVASSVPWSDTFAALGGRDVAQIESAWNGLSPEEARNFLPAVLGRYDGVGWDNIPPKTREAIVKTGLLSEERFDIDHPQSWHSIAQLEHVAQVLKKEFSAKTPNNDIQLLKDSGTRLIHLGTFYKDIPIFALDVQTGEIMVHNRVDDTRLEYLLTKYHNIGLNELRRRLNYWLSEKSFEKQDENYAQTFVNIALGRSDGLYDPKDDKTLKQLRGFADYFPGLFDKTRFEMATETERKMSLVDYLRSYRKRFTTAEKTLLQSITSIGSDIQARQRWITRHPGGRAVEQLVRDIRNELVKEVGTAAIVTIATGGIGALKHADKLRMIIRYAPDVIKTLKRIKDKHPGDIRYDQAIQTATFLIFGTPDLPDPSQIIQGLSKGK